MDPIRKAVLDSIANYFIDGYISDFMDTSVWTALEKAEAGVTTLDVVGDIALEFLETVIANPSFQDTGIWCLKDLLNDLVHNVRETKDHEFQVALGARMLRVYEADVYRGHEVKY